MTPSYPFLASELGWPPAAHPEQAPTCRERCAWRNPRARQAAAEEDGPSSSHTARRTPKQGRLEAVLLVADAALSPRKLAQLATLADATEARTLVGRLNQIFDAQASPFRIEQVAGGYRLLTRPQFAFWLGKLHHRDSDLKLSPPAMETLTVIAYRQPVTRADVEAIRGVQCAEMIRQLMERGLVRIAGEDDSLGRPFLYETTRSFLESFGLGDVADLPLAHRLQRTSAAAPPTSTAAPPADTSAGTGVAPLEAAG